MLTKFIKPTKNLSTYREKLYEVLDKAYLILRENNLPDMLRPVRSRTETICSLSGKQIFPGDYTYPCYPNPVRLSKQGKGRVLIEEAEKHGLKIFPEGYSILRIPTVEEIKKRKGVLKQEELRKQIVQNETLKLLK